MTEYVTVPAKPTEAMIDAYSDTCKRLGFHAHINASAAWESMIGAASPAPGGEVREKASVEAAGIWASAPVNKSVGLMTPLDAFEAGKRAATDAIISLLYGESGR